MGDPDWKFLSFGCQLKKQTNKQKHLLLLLSHFSHVRLCATP